MKGTKDKPAGADQPAAAEPAALRAGAPALYAAGVLAVLLVGLTGALIVFQRRYARQRAAVVAVERALAETLQRDQFRLDDAPGTLRRILDHAQMVLGRNEELESAGEQASARAHPETPRALAINAAVAVVREVLAELKERSSTPLVAQLTTALKLDASLAQAADGLERAAASERRDDLLGLLERGELDALFTVGLLLDSYFPAMPELGTIAAALAAADRLVALALATDQVAVHVRRPLSVIAIDTPGTEPFDRRRIRLIPSVRDKAARAARSLSEGQLLVVDCTSPGWSVAGRAGPEPRATIFDPASWT